MILLSTLSTILLVILGVNLFIWLNPVFGGKSKHINQDQLEASPNYKKGKFQNLEPTQMMTGNSSRGKVIKKFLFGAENDRPETVVESVPFNQESFLKSHEDNKFTWFGHSTVLININGKIILTDPVFSKAASPVSFLNKPFDFKHDYTLEDLPKLDVVLISHDHYDHLDYKTIQKINGKTNLFVVPLGVDAHLLRWGIPIDKIKIADWGDSISIDSLLQFTSTPARHFSGRGTRDRDKTLWCSWVIESGKTKVFFGGDSGYGNHFREIGEKYGPFDLTMIECGQYNENWNQIHTMPEQSVQAHIDLKGKALLPIHWSKYKLSIHPWREPIERAQKSALENNVNLIITPIGKINSL